MNRWLSGAPLKSILTCVTGLLLCGAAAVPAQELVSVEPVTQTPAQQAAAQKQVDQQLQQRILGLVPNYFVVYTPHPAPLNSRQKFQLALRKAADPMTLVGAGASGAWSQMKNDPPNFPQGAEGYGMRVAASYGTNLVGTFMGRAVFPSLLKQDPRYFYKGTGTFKSRFYYAVSNSFICMGDNGHWQVNVSETMGSLAQATATEFEYSPNDRFGVGRIAENFFISKAAYGARNLFDEFFSRRLTFPWMHRGAHP